VKKFAVLCKKPGFSPVVAMLFIAQKPGFFCFKRLKICRQAGMGSIIKP
jgi:hypothetical protein